MKTIDINTESYDEFVKGAGVKITKIGADWCSPCRAMKPILDDIAKEYDGKVKVGIIDAEESQDLMRTLGVGNIPVITIFKDGEEVYTVNAAVPPAKLKGELNKLL